MAEIDIMTPRGIRLSGDFVNPVDTQGIAVLFVHSFLSDRHNNGWFDAMASFYRGAGYATLQLDCSGSGRSDDDVITLDGIVEDIRSACNWLEDKGFPRITIHGHGLGGQAALKARPPQVNNMVMTSPACDQRDIPWNEIFTDEQLSNLEHTGYMPIPDDEASERDYFVVSQQTLRDMTMVPASQLLEGLEIPTLFIFDEGDVHTGRAHLLTDNWQMLPDVGHRVTYIKGLEFSDPFDIHKNMKSKLTTVCDQWMEEHQPLLRAKAV